MKYEMPEFDLSTAAYSEDGVVMHYYTEETMLREIAAAVQRAMESKQCTCAAKDMPFGQCWK